MELKEAIKMEKVDFIERLKLRKAKGHDYASEEDCLVNFKNMAELLRILGIWEDATPSKVALFYILLKLDRTCNLLYRRKTKPKNESVRDTVAMDMPNYIDLFKENLIDEGLLNGE